MRLPIFTDRRALSGAAIAVAVGGFLLVLGAVLDRSRAALAYLVAFAFVVSLALGALVFQMIVRAMDAKWPVAVRRLTEASIATFPVLLFLSLPLFLSIGRLYPWAHPENIKDLEARRVIELKSAYLNRPFFVLRGIFVLLIFVLLGEILARLSRARNPNEAEVQRLRGRRISAGALPLVGLAATFAAFDWLMSLEPTWYSSTFGIYYFTGGFLGSLRFSCFLRRVQWPPLALLSLWILFMHYLDLYWVVLPSHPQENVRGVWLDCRALLFIGGSAVAVAVLRQRDRVLLPEGDALLEAALRYHSQ
jgi:hypothetical protein